MHERDFQHKKATKTNQKIHCSNYKRLRNIVNMKVKKAKCNYYSTKLSNDQNPKEIWKTLNELTSYQKRTKQRQEPPKSSQPLSSTSYLQLLPKVYAVSTKIPLRQKF